MLPCVPFESCNEIFIDELRIYPKGSFITTYTYDPMIGITSQCDANNKLLYYHYDELGRLIAILDKDKNVIKAICYSYAGQIENCNIHLRTNANPDWQNTTTLLRCQLNSSSQNTGYQEQEQKDMNPYSPTYNQLQWITAGYNTTACPLPSNCNTSNCTGVNKKCVYGVCETGVKIYTGYYPDPAIGKYWCIYHYEWSDGSWSQDYQEITTMPASCNPA
jgi:YD repeat-containing protein